MIDESCIVEMYPKLSGYDSPELKYAISIVYRTSKDRVYFYSSWENAMKDRNQLIELVQARKLDA
jgi:hypothetical protein